MKTINGIIEDVLATEGGYVNDARDAGGETNFGITIATARAQGYAGPMRAMPRDFAFEVYRRQYVIAPGFDKVEAVAGNEVAAELIDTGVNMGPRVAAQFLQRALNGLNNQARDYADVVVDGSVGPGTLAALKAFVAKRGTEGERRLLALLNALQGSGICRYVRVAARARPFFTAGWRGWRHE